MSQAHPDIRVLRPAKLADWCRRVANAEELLGGEVIGRSMVTAPHECVVCTVPVTVDDIDRQFAVGAMRPDASGCYRFPLAASRLDCVPDASVTGDRFIVMSADDRVFEETFWNPANLDDGRWFRSVSLKVMHGPTDETAKLSLTLFGDGGRPAQELERAVLLGNPWAHNYHHWLIDCLARLWHLRDLPQIWQLPLLIPPPVAFHSASLAAMGLLPSQFVSSPNGLTRVGQLIIPTNGNFSPRQLTWVADSILRGLGIGRPRPHRRIFVSRADASERRLVNENRLRSSLEQAGFETVVGSQMSFAEQVRQFSEAALIVGAHGAGLTNAIFAPPGATLIDLHPRDTVNHCFWLQTSAIGQRYALLPCECQSSSSRDMFVEVDRLTRLIDHLDQFKTETAG